MIQNHNIDIIMEDALQEEEIKELPFSNNEKVGDYDIDIKMDVLHLENKNTSLLKTITMKILKYINIRQILLNSMSKIKLSTWIFWVMI
jgi:hypothetical protein